VTASERPATAGGWRGRPGRRAKAHHSRDRPSTRRRSRPRPTPAPTTASRMRLVVGAAWRQECVVAPASAGTMAKDAALSGSAVDSSAWTMSMETFLAAAISRPAGSCPIPEGLWRNEHKRWPVPAAHRDTWTCSAGMLGQPSAGTRRRASGPAQGCRVGGQEGRPAPRHRARRSLRSPATAKPACGQLLP